MSNKRMTVVLGAAILCLAMLVPFTTTAEAIEDGDRRLIGNFVQDGQSLESHWAEGQIRYLTYGEDAGDFNAFIIQVIGGVRVTEALEAGVYLPFGQVDPAKGDSESGLLNIQAYGKYTFFTDPCHLAAGLILELPTGDEDLGPGQGELHFDAFAAVRYPLESHNIDLIGNAGFRYNADAKWGDHELEGEMAFRVGGGALFGITEQIDVSGEFLFQTENYKDAEEEIWLLAGGHFAITEAWKVRAGLQLGLSDAAPDFGIIAGVVYQF